jgi:hypothetical protein
MEKERYNAFVFALIFLLAIVVLLVQNGVGR